MTGSDLGRSWYRVWPPRVPAAMANMGIIGATGAIQVLSFALALPRNWLLAILIGLIQTVPLFWRRRWPLVVLVVLATGGSIQWLSGVHLGGYLVAVPATVYAVAYCSGSARWLLFSGLLMFALYAAVSGVTEPHNIRTFQAAFAGVGILSVFLMGENARLRDAQLAEMQRQLTRQKGDREEDRRRAVEAERMRIARELHDVVAHHVSAIAVEAAAERAARPTDAAAEALSRIAATARLALTELSQLLGVLRREPYVRPPRTPEPGLEQAYELVAQAKAGGLDVHLVVFGTPRPLPKALDLSAYRVVQEAITNARKHADGARVEVNVRYGVNRLQIRVTDDGTSRLTRRSLDTAGHGLVGMRERVEVFGGHLQAGPLPAGGFQVSADLPIEPLS